MRSIKKYYGPIFGDFCDRAPTDANGLNILKASVLTRDKEVSNTFNTLENAAK
jgi:hypothetical protein